MSGLGDWLPGSILIDTATCCLSVGCSALTDSDEGPLVREGGVYVLGRTSDRMPSVLLATGRLGSGAIEGEDPVAEGSTGVDWEELVPRPDDSRSVEPWLLLW
jgi:hypothetical protein